MRQYGVYEFDNRDSAEVYQYMEARIEALKSRIEELEQRMKYFDVQSLTLQCFHWSAQERAVKAIEARDSTIAYWNITALAQPKHNRHAASDDSFSNPSNSNPKHRIKGLPSS